MTPYLTLFLMHAKTLGRYRAAALAAVATQFFWGLIGVMIYRAFYAGAAQGAPLSLSQTVTFLWLNQALLQLVPWSIDKEVASQIRKGHVAYSLIHPLSLYALWFTRSCSLRTIPTLMRALPIFLLGGWFGLTPPASWLSGCCFLLSLCLAIPLAAAITTILLLSLFWTLSGEGIQKLVPHVTLLLAGVVVPIPLFPSWLQPFMTLQPFRGVMDIPCRFYTGLISVADAPYYYVFQLVWTAILLLVGGAMLRGALRRLIIQGG